MSRPQFRHHADFIHLLYGKPAREYGTPWIESIIDIIDSFHEDNITLLTRYLTTGPDSARVAVKEYIVGVISIFASQYEADEYDLSGYSAEEEQAVRDDQWEALLERYAHPAIANSARHNWHTVSVLEETGSILTLEQVVTASKGMRVLEPLIHSSGSGDSATDEYWRGLAAVLISGRTGMNPDLDDEERVPAFIDWAGKHEDIGAAINAAIERSTFNVESLRAIMEEQRGKTVLRGGVL